MKWIWYEYAGDGRSQSYPTARPQREPHSESYYPAHPFRLMVWYGDAPLRPPATYKVCQTPFICMKWIWYEYAEVGRSQSYPTARPQCEPHSNPTTGLLPPIGVIYGMVLWHSDYQPWLKAFKHFLYV
jgi:hypothetical protein